jgi:beta-carotene/zeaxanthin 4-ketolase
VLLVTTADSSKRFQQNQQTDWTSLVIAICIFSVWALSLITLFTADLAHVPLWIRPLLTLWQAFLYTGLFITAHDAMHGVVCPQNRFINNAVGMIALRLYGLFSFKTLLQRHIQHHQSPASHVDPDYHDGGFLGWYWTFMVRYWSWTRFIALVVTFHLLHTFFGISESNLAWAWVYPSILSSLHLFYFGTYLPHRQPALGYSDAHRSTTTHRPWLLSLLACYHFGYHHEHHRLTDVPWWRLPEVYAQQQAAEQVAFNKSRSRKFSLKT